MALRVVEVAGPDEVTLAEAAELLGVHPNTIRNRIRSGTYQARKVQSPLGPEIYLIKRAELDIPTAPPPAPWRHYVKQFFWSDDPRQRRVQAVSWILGGLANAAIYGFFFGRVWERLYEWERESPRR
jgi:excisionase family DNA binding protein